MRPSRYLCATHCFSVPTYFVLGIVNRENHIMRVLRTGLLVAACWALVPHVTHADVINTYTGWNGSDYILPFGETDTATYGQTFTVGADTVLDNFSFWLNDDVNPDRVDFRAYVMAWHASNHATGPVLWSSSTTTTGGTSSYEQFTFNTGGLTLTQGLKYVAFLNASLDFDSIYGTSRMAARYTSAYSGGNFVYLNHGSNFSALTSPGWTSEASYDAVFLANFSAPSPVVPEPGSILAMLSLVSFGAGAVVLRRRRAKQLAA